jgi:transcriptional antiterminator RfaH
MEGDDMKAWYLLTTKLKSELRVKQNLLERLAIETFFPVFPAKTAGSPIGLPLFPRYVFAHFDLHQEFDKVQYSPGVSRLVSFGDIPKAVPDEVIACLRTRCDNNDVLVHTDLIKGQKVKVTTGVFEGCQGIISEKRGNNRIQLLMALAFGPPIKVELDLLEVEVAR